MVNIEERIPRMQKQNSFHLEPAPRNRKPAKKRQDGDKTASKQKNMGRYQEHLSWNLTPSTALLAQDTGINLADAPPLPSIDSVSARALMRKPSVPRSVREGSDSEPTSPADSESTRIDDAQPSPMHILTPSTQEREICQTPDKEDCISKEDINVRLSTQAGSVASIRRATPKPTSPVCSPGRISFSRRQRSMSSVCSLSPTSPSGLRKRLGRRGQEKEKRQRDSIVIALPPMSPLTPRRAETVHTPRTATKRPSMTLLTVVRSGCDMDAAPLSATLRELGAKRVDEELLVEVSEDAHIPPWAKRFQAQHHRKTEILEQNRKAANDFVSLVPLKDNMSQMEGLPRVSLAGDVAPDSPNGDLLSGDTGRAWKRPSELISQSQPGEDIWGNAGPGKIQSSGRALVVPPQNSWSRRISGLVSALRTPMPGSANRAGRGWKVNLPYRRTAAETAIPKTQDDTRDGWGGIMTRSSWFKNHAVGPLLSPEPAVPKQERRARLKSLHLVNGAPLLPSQALAFRPKEPEDVWEDVEEIQSDAGTVIDDDKPALERGVPRFKMTRFSNGSSSTLVNGKYVYDDQVFVIGHQEPSNEAKEEDTTTEVNYTDKSIEGRPRMLKQRISKTKLLIMVLVGLFLVSVIVNIVVLSKHKPGVRPPGGIFGPAPVPTTLSVEGSTAATTETPMLSLTPTTTASEQASPAPTQGVSESREVPATTTENNDPDHNFAQASQAAAMSHRRRHLHHH